MSLVFRISWIVAIFAWLALPAALVFAQPDMMAVDQIKPGMWGFGKTVVSGTKIERFDVNVLGVMKKKGPAGDLILVRVSGDILDRTGGIAQGMSGSPVYINGKLIGAIAYGWPFTDHKTVMVTPIADMLKLWNLPVKETGRGETSIAADLEKEATPLMAAGFSDGALDLLKQKLAPLKLVPFDVGDAPADAVFGPLEPGSAVGVQLVRGDVSLGALGTVTYVEGNKVLAFGHPFLKKGESGYFLTSGYVFTTVNGLENAFKLGTTGPALGLIDQDRGAGVSGETGRFPRSIPLHINVSDNSLGQTREAEVQVAQDEQLAPTLAAASVFSVIEKTMDRIGPGTAKVSFELSAKNMPREVFKRENMFYSPGNINELAVSEIHELLTLLASNQFQTVDVLDVKVNVAVQQEQRTATVVQASSSVLNAKPGDKIDVLVNLKPYRGENVGKTVPFIIPKNQAPGPLMLEVRGGGIIPLIELLKRQVNEGQILKLADKQKNLSFSDMLKELAERDHNNDIVVEVLNSGLGNNPGDSGQADLPEVKLDPDQNASPGESGKLQPDGKNSDSANKPEDNAKGKLSTDYIIDGDTQIVVNITRADGSMPGSNAQDRRAQFRKIRDECL